uniref:Uncharacterized protein n=1 Tax=Globisporangium ultimum (strain ATCC 200006 / CBS 805.95 / DAOM BR144) TaxID=431595 RepID=K3WQP6_GLOUD
MTRSGNQFTCAFTRRNCTHTALFGPQYQRCFPHCCPHHVARSYCGAPVHLQVDLSDTPSPVPTATSVDSEKEIVGDENLVVFGRFRVEKARGLALGHKLSTDVLSHSLQSKANPTGDWIAAKLIASAGHNTWLFEVNASANWFYDWEVGAVRMRRAETHVFEVYVFYKQPPDPSNHFGVSTADVDGMPVSKKRAVQIETVEVVAIATSSPFTLLSFRRAPLPRGFGLPADGYDQEEQKQAVMQKTELQDGSSAKNDSQDNVDAEMNLYELLKIPGTSTAPPVCDNFTAVYDRLTPSVDQSPVAGATTNMAIVLWFLRQIPINVIATLSLLPSIESTLHASLVEHLAAEGAGLVTALRGPLVDLNLARAVAPFVDSCDSLPRLVSVDPADEDDDKVAIEALGAEFSQLAEIGVKLAIWMLFDRDNNARIEAFIQRSARVLLDKVALCKSYQAFAEWLQERIDEYLSQDQWYLEGLVKRIINWGYTCKSRGNRHELDGILSSDDNAVAAGDISLGTICTDADTPEAIHGQEDTATGIVSSTQKYRELCAIRWTVDV